MHGTYTANMAVMECDLLIALLWRQKAFLAERRMLQSAHIFMISVATSAAWKL